MNAATVQLLAGFGVISAAALGQTPTFVYAIQGPPLFLCPGQTATITVLCGFSPGIGATVSTPIGPRPVIGLSAGGFNIVASGGTWSGITLLNPYIVGSAGQLVGANVMGITWSNGVAPPAGVVSTLNPTPLWTGTYTAPNTSAVVTINPSGPHGVWAGNPGEVAIEVQSQLTQGAQASFICPAPAAVSLMALAGPLAVRRRRPTAAPVVADPSGPPADARVPT